MTLATLGIDPQESEVVESVIQSVRGFAQRNLDARRIDQEKAIPRSILEGMAELGLFGLSLPEAYGGFGLSLQATGAVLAALAEYDRSVATTLGLHCGLGTRGLVSYGSEALKSAYLPSLAAGDRIASFCATEPEAGSDLTAIRSVLQPAGEGLCLNGQKAYVTNAGFAGCYTLLVSSPGLGGSKRGQSMVLVDRNDPGLSLGAEEDKLGLRGSSTRPVYFNDVPLSLDRVFEAPGQGKEQVEYVLTWGRIAMAAGACGATQKALNLMGFQVQNRKQFGRLLSEMDVVAEHIADNLALYEAMIALMRRAASSDESTPEFMGRSLAVKVFNSESSFEIIDTTLQLHGGLGFIEETGVALLLRDARITRIFEGANDVLLGRLAQLKLATGEPRKPLGHAAADRLATRRREHQASLKKELGVRLFRQPRALKRLGQLAVFEEALDAAVLKSREEGLDDSQPLLSHLSDLLSERAEALFVSATSLANIQSIRDSFIGQQTR